MEMDLAKMRFVSVADGSTCVGELCDECIFNGGKYSAFGDSAEYCCFEKTEKCFNHHPNYVFVKRNAQRVVIFSKFCIPFNIPKSNEALLANFKADIISAVKNMQLKNNCILQARYGTVKKLFFDVENVLFYNIGTANFNELAKNGVVFCAVEKQELNKLRKKYNIPNEYEHYYEFSVVAKNREKSFNNLVAEWKNISLKCIGLKPASVWKTFKREKAKIAVYGQIDVKKRDPFAVCLEIEKPKGEKFKVMTAMKPLLDGLICAMQYSNYSDTDLEYFSQKINCEKSLFTDKSTVVFLSSKGNKFLQKYPNNVKWNPVDDLCNYVIIKVKEGVSWNLSGKVYSIIKCPYCGKGKISKLIYGSPAMTDELMEEINAGKAKLAGCVVDGDFSRYYCNWCKKTF